jgi:hypothetical protein
MRTVEYTFTATDQAGLQTSVTEMVQVDDGGGNPDYGRNLRSWILQPGGQELVLPDGVYTAQDIASGGAHSQFLILRAQNPGGVIVDDNTVWTGVTRVMFVGIEFRQRIHFSSGNDRIVTWYCKHRHPYGDGNTNNNQQGILINGGTRLRFMGADIFDCTKDGIHMSSTDAEFLAQGVRVWNTVDPAGVNHDDAFQARGGTFEFRDYVFGVNPDDQLDGNGHVQIQADIGNCTGSFINGWSAASGNYGYTVDGKNSGLDCHIVRNNVRSWGHQFGDITTTGGGTHQSVGTITSAPVAGATPPCDVWRNANPYNTYASWLQAVSGL